MDEESDITGKTETINSKYSQISGSYASQNSIASRSVISLGQTHSQQVSATEKALVSTSPAI